MKTRQKFFWVMLLVIAPAAFAQPAGEPSLPTVESVLERALERAALEAENDRLFEERYAFTRTRVTEHRDDKGELKQREEKKRTKNPALIPVVHRGPAAPVENTGGEKKKAFEKKGFRLDEEFLKRFEFAVVGREVLDGRPSLIVDFKPAKEQPKPKDLKDRFINKVAGRLWFDEADAALVRANVRLTDNITLVGGIIGNVTKFTCSFDRARTEDGLWYTRLVNWHAEGRKVLVQRVIDYQEEKADVQKVR